MYEHALELAERLTHDHPEVIDYQGSLINSHGQIGWNYYRLLGRDQDAYNSYRKALELAEELVRKNPGLESEKEEVEYYNNELGRVLARLGKPQEAIEHYRKALLHCEERERANPGGVLEQRSLAYLCFEMGRIHLALGSSAEASSELARAGDLFAAVADSKALSPYNRACAHAIRAGIVGMGKTDLTPEELAQRKAYTDRALAVLREAISGGHQSAEMIESDIDFDSIRSNEDFQALMADLKARSQVQAASTAAGKAGVLPALER
jgi:tetratricopeptide (TPR) repeat protein